MTLRRLEAIELFGSVSEEEKLQYLQLLGGVNGIKQSFTNKDMLSLDLTANTTITAAYVESNNYALRIRRRRKMIDGQWHYQFMPEIVGCIPLTAKFREMADFTANLPEKNYLDIINDKVFSDNLDESIAALRNIELPNRGEHLEYLEQRVKDNRLRKARGEKIEGVNTQPIGLVQPPRFYRAQVFNNYLYHNKLFPVKTTGKNKATGETYERYISKHRAKLDSGETISADQYPAPSAMTEESRMALKAFTRKDLLQKVAELFEQRPCWTRLSLCAQFSTQDARTLMNQKYCLSGFFYTFSSGPYADTMCRIGWDPRLDSANRIYQRVQTRAVGMTDRKSRQTYTVKTNTGRSASVNPKPSAASTSESPLTKEPSPDSYKFDGKHLPDAANFQLCDVSDEDCVRLINDENGHIENFDSATGYFSADQLNKIKRVIKRKIVVLKQENRQLTQEELDLLLIPGDVHDDSDEEQTTQTPVASKSTRAKAQNLRQSILSGSVNSK
ncbi:hypothetical protein E3P99_02660 [Wallemia hederae]|uniref:Uncharacterized protein n=1 Tax=Wallemia hederae TaxID=1540922 RepID=A0A4T0FL16_9BASI|nr:hypothetical protein E3P99_02660 [Wallemia hederae]